MSCSETLAYIAGIACLKPFTYEYGCPLTVYLMTGTQSTPSDTLCLLHVLWLPHTTRCHTLHAVGGPYIAHAETIYRWLVRDCYICCTQPLFNMDLVRAKEECAKQGTTVHVYPSQIVHTEDAVRVRHKYLLSYNTASRGWSPAIFHYDLFCYASPAIFLNCFKHA